jgi:hypothetical protein
MDKFAREYLDPKTGMLEGGYINSRFVVYHDQNSVGEPMNSPRMSLKAGERTRAAKPYEYSTERRLEEQRKKDSTTDISLETKLENENLKKEASITKRTPVIESKQIHLASVDTLNPIDSVVDNLFSESIALHLKGMDKEDAVLKLSEKYNVSVHKVASIQDMAIRKYDMHNGQRYVMASFGKNASEYMQIRPKCAIEAKNISTGKVERLSHNASELLKESDKPDQRINGVFQLLDLSKSAVKGLYQIDVNDSGLESVSVEDATRNYQREMAMVSYETGLADTPQTKPVGGKQPIAQTTEAEDEVIFDTENKASMNNPPENVEESAEGISPV